MPVRLCRSRSFNLIGVLGGGNGIAGAVLVGKQQYRSVVLLGKGRYVLKAGLKEG